ncbi:alpha/beta fold hydrolase [Rhizobacter sp. SG703]|uniref:alpha/beta fold hydrolase n=1 Tax=Rhizobacter sp. SG703 TaxID=2587140 RepID=UPI0014481349|nr:alpha/beta fold hydrolase [Rhizobacter sp. SG703]NKI96454.1 pimeloyl-ACP methyl ester carboxylesterase [Rhizobacter sp. SG703]
MSTPNPATAFYAASRSARWLGSALRGLQSLSPGLGTRLALRLFFTPLPLKLAARRRAVPAGWQLSHWPFEHGTVAVYRRADLPARPGEERPTVLLVHGWAGDALQMQPLGDALAAAGFAPVLLDFPAHGRSAAWRSTLPQFARALWAASARLGPLHAVVAHSLGALAASHAAASGLPVKRLALVAPSPPPGLFLDWFSGSFGLGAGLAGRMRTAIERREGVPLQQFEPAWLGARLDQPTLLLHDEGDRVAPLAGSQALQQALPDARLATTRGLGHRRVLSDAESIAAVVEHVRAK